MRDWQYSWGVDKDGLDFHFMEFFDTDCGWGTFRLTAGINRPSSYYMSIPSHYDDCNKPRAWEIV